MTQQDKELLIKDLCARLPYGVKVMTPDIDRGNVNKFESGIYTLDSIDTRGHIEVYEEDMGLIYAPYIKPILFPLSAINQKIEVNGKKRCITKKINNYSYSIDYLGRIDVEKIYYLHLNEYLEIIALFNRYHIDYRDLIGKGLAISVFDLPENPYK